MPDLAASPVPLELISVKRIWQGAPHNAFGDLIRFRDRWFCVFRQARGHVARPGDEDDGQLRVIASKDGDEWESQALIAEPGIDLRDPHLSLTPDNRLMIIAGGSEYPQGVYRGRRSRVFFSPNGRDWSSPAPVVERGHWLWRVTWHNGRAYGVSKYGSPSKELPEDPRRVDLVTSTDGIHWQTITELKVPGGDETTLRFLPDGRMAALMRRVWSDGNIAWIGVSSAPYKDWKWNPAGTFIGGPNFIVLNDGRMVAGGRVFTEKGSSLPKTMLGTLAFDRFEPGLTLPSNGDSSYPGFVLHQGQLWTMYYSSHEGSTAIYLARVRVRAA